ncbi:MAG: hypothetical protein LUO93_09005 [Methanomicrobiales archaeon]|nr:hypothetical protein [Methanomicrobiales archaeon]
MNWKGKTTGMTLGGFFLIIGIAIGFVGVQGLMKYGEVFIPMVAISAAPIIFGLYFIIEVFLETKP